MDSTKTFELKVGLFIMIGVAILFFIVFSVGEINFSKTGYKIKVLFNFANGIGGTAPVRLAGVGIGQVQGIRVMRDDKTNTTRAELTVWVNDNIKIENDAVVTINTLGLLGEKYLEIIPGISADMIKDDSMIIGQDPVPIERIAESVSTLMTKLQVTVDSVNNGILTDKNKQSLEDALAGFGALGTDLKEGRGTLGKLITDESIYDNLDDLTSDLKGNPWKLLYRPKPKE